MVHSYFLYFCIMVQNLTEAEMSLLAKAERYCANEEQCRTSVRKKLCDWGATPDSSNGWIMDDQELLEKYAASTKGDLIICGHTHRFDVQSAGGKDFIFCPNIGAKKRTPVSPNMLFLELINGKWELDPVFVDFDLTELNSDFESSGLIDYGKIYTKAVIASYERGDDTALTLVTEAWRLAREDGYSGDINLPEEYWERAAENIGLDI